MWILDKNGDFNSFNTDISVCLEIDPDSIPNNFNEKISDIMADIKSIKILFSNYADGRGFSLVRKLRKYNSPVSVTIFAEGYILPDQTRHCFQCGFDAIIISDELLAHHGSHAWHNALKNTIPDIYHMLDKNENIWEKRHKISSKTI